VSVELRIRNGRPAGGRRRSVFGDRKVGSPVDETVGLPFSDGRSIRGNAASPFVERLKPIRYTFFNARVLAAWLHLRSHRENFFAWARPLA